MGCKPQTFKISNYSRLSIVEVENFLNLTKSKNFTNAKSPPNGLNCLEQVSTTVDAFIFQALAVFFLSPLPMRFFLV